MAKVGVYNFEIIQGADINDLDITLKEDDGDAIDLSGYSARLQIRPNVKSAILNDDLSTTNGRMAITNYIDGEGEEAQTCWKIMVYFPSGTTSAYTWKKGVYNLETYSPGLLVDRILEGEVTVSQEVVRP